MNWKKINLYILLSFSISWLTALAMKLSGVDYGSTLSVIITGALYMAGPAIATFVIQKFIFKGGFKQYGWSFDKKKIKWLLFTPLIFIALLLLTFSVIGLLGNTGIIQQFGQLDFSQESFDVQFKAMLAYKVDVSKVKIPSVPASLFLVISLIQGILAGATINLPFMFGEEFGWRGLMLTETKKLGFITSNLFIGLVWGLWHLPLILMGHNYPNHPYFGIAMMCFMTIGLAPIFAYIRIKTKSIIGPCMLHGMINATAALFALYIKNPNELYSSVAGWAGIIACVIITACIYLFDKQFVKNYATKDIED